MSLKMNSLEKGEACCCSATSRRSAWVQSFAVKRDGRPSMLMSARAGRVARCLHLPPVCVLSPSRLSSLVSRLSSLVSRLFSLSLSLSFSISFSISFFFFSFSFSFSFSFTITFTFSFSFTFSLILFYILILSARGSGGGFSSGGDFSAASAPLGREEDAISEDAIVISMTNGERYEVRDESLTHVLLL